MAAANSVTLSWDDPGDESITGYVVLRRNRDGKKRGDNDGPATFTTIAADTGTAGVSYTDSTVAANTRYEYRIRAVNANGRSPRSAAANADTPERQIGVRAVPAKPTGLQVTSVTNTEPFDERFISHITVSWDNPNDSTILQYQKQDVDTRPLRDESDGIVAFGNRNSTSYTFRQLFHEVPWNLRIRARNADGWGPWASIRVNLPRPFTRKKPTDSPSRLKAIHFNRGVRLSWKGVNNHPDGYRVRHRQTSETEWGDWTECTSRPSWDSGHKSRIQAVFRGLMNNTSYDFQVQSCYNGEEDDYDEDTDTYGTPVSDIIAKTPRSFSRPIRDVRVVGNELVWRGASHRYLDADDREIVLQFRHRRSSSADWGGWRDVSSANGMHISANRFRLTYSGQFQMRAVRYVTPAVHFLEHVVVFDRVNVPKCGSFPNQNDDRFHEIVRNPVTGDNVREFQQARFDAAVARYRECLRRRSDALQENRDREKAASDELDDMVDACGSEPVRPHRIYERQVVPGTGLNRIQFYEREIVRYRRCISATGVYTGPPDWAIRETSNLIGTH